MVYATKTNKQTNKNNNKKQQSMRDCMKIIRLVLKQQPRSVWTCRMPSFLHTLTNSCAICTHFEKFMKIQKTTKTKTKTKTNYRQTVHTHKNYNNNNKEDNMIFNNNKNRRALTTHSLSHCKRIIPYKPTIKR